LQHCRGALQCAIHHKLYVILPLMGNSSVGQALWSLLCIQCGEAFAAWLPGWGVPFSYAVAISYVLTDTYDKWARARKQARQELNSIDLDPAVVEGR
jgi:hypothetical protein